MTCDDEEFTRFFHKHYASLCRFLECMSGGRRSVAQELAQESFLRLYRARLETNEDETRFWLYRVARNLALNELKRGGVRRRLVEKVTQVFRHKELDPEEEYEQREQARLVSDMLGALPEHQRAALLLREIEEMSYREIAEVLCISEAKVKVDLFRARRALGERWSENVKRADRLKDERIRSNC